MALNGTVGIVFSAAQLFEQLSKLSLQKAASAFFNTDLYMASPALYSAQSPIEPLWGLSWKGLPLRF